VTDEFATLVPAGKRLRRFEKVELLPGQTKEVSFELNDQDLIFYDNQERPQIEPGKFTLSIKEQNISFIYTE
jgi:beta-glucosidase